MNQSRSADTPRLAVRRASAARPAATRGRTRRSSRAAGGTRLMGAGGSESSLVERPLDGVDQVTDEQDRGYQDQQPLYRSLAGQVGGPVRDLLGAPLAGGAE